MACITCSSCHCPTRPRELTFSIAGFQVNKTMPYPQNNVSAWVSRFRVILAEVCDRFISSPTVHCTAPLLTLCCCWCACPGSRPPALCGECLSPLMSPRLTAGTGWTAVSPLVDHCKSPSCTTAAFGHLSIPGATAWHHSTCRWAASPQAGHWSGHWYILPHTAIVPIFDINDAFTWSAPRLADDVAGLPVPPPGVGPLGNGTAQAQEPCVEWTGHLELPVPPMPELVGSHAPSWVLAPLFPHAWHCPDSVITCLLPRQVTNQFPSWLTPGSTFDSAWHGTADGCAGTAAGHCSCRPPTGSCWDTHLTCWGHLAGRPLGLQALPGGARQSLAQPPSNQEWR